jgi:kojibiose phosphorylase/nigerose phosphorylase
MRNVNSAWVIERNGYNKEEFVDNGNRFLIGNGFMGVRGALEECRACDKPAVNLAGIYDKSDGASFAEPVNAPNGFFAELRGAGEVLRHKQSLNIRHGVHSRETEYENASLYIERFVSMDNPNLMCQMISVKPKRGVKLVCGIDGDVWDLNGRHLFDHRAYEQGGAIVVSAVTGEKRVPIPARGSNEMRERESGERGAFLPITVAETCSRNGGIILEEKSAYREFDVTENITVERVITVNAEPLHGDYESLKNAHADRWEQLWADSEVVIESAIEGDDEARLALNYSVYHLHSIAPRHADNLSIPARGLSGQTYKGAVFWDTEIFLLPFFEFTEPALARKLVKYRIDTLEGALAKAAEYELGGAFYAWESQEGGREGCTDFNVTDVFTGRPVRTYFRDKQIHISGDVAYALCKYADITGDSSISEEGGDRVLAEIAKFFTSRAYCKAGSGTLEFTDVVGPDEYHDRVDNNAFTNRLARFALERAGSKHGVREPRKRGGVIEQFDGYFKLEDAALAEVRSRVKHPREYWGTPSGVAFPTQIIKQADVIAMMHLFAEEYTDEEVRANWEFYEPRTEHGSSLSACMYALTACRFGRADLAYPLFMKSARADLEGGGKSWAGDVYIGGTHPAAAGGAWQIAVFGFAGLRAEGDTLTVKPCLPDGIKSISFPVIFRGKRYRADVSRDDARIQIIT